LAIAALGGIVLPSYVLDASIERGSMNQPQLSAQDFFLEASDLTLSLTSGRGRWTDEDPQADRRHARKPWWLFRCQAPVSDLWTSPQAGSWGCQGCRPTDRISGYARISASAEHSTSYVDGPEEFSAAITAALNKKHVPVQVTLDGQQADYILRAAGLQNETESGKSQVARCLFMVV
jgi:hypothetical protein